MWVSKAKTNIRLGRTGINDRRQNQIQTSMAKQNTKYDLMIDELFEKEK